MRVEVGLAGKRAVSTGWTTGPGSDYKQIAAKLALSPRTVSTHLYRIFPKLGVTSRAGLRDAMNGTVVT